MNVYNLDILSFLNNNDYISQRNLAEESGYSLGKVNESLKDLISEGYLTEDHQLTDKAKERIQENKPKHAVILAAGYGMRMVPINFEQPKGLLNVKGEPFSTSFNIVKPSACNLFALKLNSLPGGNTGSIGVLPPNISVSP